MSYEQYWDGDCEITKYYRRKKEYDMQRRNLEMCVQGAYIYRAILDAAPVLNPLSKEKKAFPYESDLIPLTETEYEKSLKERERKMMNDRKQAFKAMVESFNKKFEQKEVKDGN